MDFSLPDDTGALFRFDSDHRGAHAAVLLAFFRGFW